MIAATVTAERQLRGLPPLVGADARVLILGSFPSAASLAAGQYYGHPRNHFWTIVLTLLTSAPNSVDIDINLYIKMTYDEGLAVLATAGIGLWDVYAACRRRGSLDQAIREAEINDIAALLAERPQIDRILLNGGEAARAWSLRLTPTFAKRGWRPEGRLDRIGDVAVLRLPNEGSGAGPRGSEAGSRNIVCIRLPSTSPVPSARFKTAADKLPYWRAVLMSSESWPTYSMAQTNNNAVIDYQDEGK